VTEGSIGFGLVTEWIAPEVERPGGADIAPERQAAEELLEYHRATLLWKCAGLSGEQLAQRSSPPSTLSLLGLVRHMAEVERVWFRVRIAGEDIERIYGPWGADFDQLDPARAEEDFATYAAEVDAARAILATKEYDDTFTYRHRQGESTIDVRALVLHMIEEYARHNGHADLLREAVDGRTGD
jgi:uncharacterized damage-inducible protein DinB